ncbi:hypothetical protein ACFY84_23650 [Streptomyces sp. NPDC012438]|uniref:hypothetical protein n=1 Tax=Streptomyces sp. NPDC012438 TaxID=3364833 RepID=UPI0036ECB3B3
MDERAIATGQKSVTELGAQIDAGAFWRLVPESVPREYAEPTRALVEQVHTGLKRLVGDPGGATEHPCHWEPGDVARDTRTERVGRVMGHVGPRYQLRPLTGGREWEAHADDMVPARQSDAMSPQVRELNRRSRDHAPRSW